MARSKLQMAQQWADIVIERWQKRMAALDIGDTGELLRSFQAQVASDSNGDPSKITFTFLYYGRFPDMGVGRGVTLADVPDERRKPKPWYSKTFLGEVVKLGRFMAAKYGMDAADAISAFSDGLVGIGKNDEAWYRIKRTK